MPTDNQTEAEVITKKPKVVTSHFYGGTEEERCLQLAKLIETAFLNHFTSQGGVLREHIHNYYICKLRNCTDISAEDQTKMKKDNKFQHKWLTDPDIALCKETRIWSLCYIDNKGMFCGLCRIHNTCQPSNNSKVWNTEANIRCRSGTVKGHLLQASKRSITMHGIATSLEKSKYSSYFVTKEKERENYINSSYLAVFKALYWLAKEEVANAKTVSLLGLLEELGVKEVDAFTTRSESVLRKMVVLIANTITEKIVKKIKKSEAFGLLTDEVTDISNVQQLVSFIQFFDEEIGDCVTKFIETADLLESSHNSSPDADAIFSCLVKLLQKHGLDLNELKGFGSDGASVMTGRHRGVAAKFKSLEECKTMINIHCVCHRLALACADTGDELKFIQDFEKTALELWSFFKKSPKRLKIYIKVTLGVRNFDAMSKRQKKKLVRKVKKAVRTRWLSLNASVDSISQEYVGLVHALRSMQEDRNCGSTAKGLLKKIDSVQFLGTLYLLKFVLPHLSALSRTFQAGNLNFCRISPSIQITKGRIDEVVNENKVIKELEKDLKDRLQLCNLSMEDRSKEIIQERVKKYSKAICKNIDDRFPTDSLAILGSFSVFDVTQVPSDISAPDFKVYGQSEITAIKEHFHQEQQVGNEFLEQWKDMKYELLQLKTKWLQFKDNVESNNMKIKFSPTECVLRKIVKDYQHDEQFALVYRVAKVALVTPVTNAWPERGASAVKRIKTRSRSSMKSDFLNALLMISINGPALKTKEYQELMEEVAIRYANEKHRNCPRSFISVVRKKSSSSSTQTVDIDELSEIEET